MAYRVLLYLKYFCVITLFKKHPRSQMSLQLLWHIQTPTVPDLHKQSITKSYILYITCSATGYELEADVKM